MNGSAKDLITREERQNVIQYLLKAFREKHNFKTDHEEEKLQSLVVRMEEKLYAAAQSKDEYLDPKTIGARIRGVLKSSYTNGASSSMPQVQEHQQQHNINNNHGAGIPMPVAPSHQPQPQQIQPNIPPPSTGVTTDVQQQPVQHAFGAAPLPLPLPPLPPPAAAAAAAAAPPPQGPLVDPLAGGPGLMLNGVVGVGNGLAIAGAPAGMSTAESGLRISNRDASMFAGSYMTNGAPVLLRGGGGGGIMPQMAMGNHQSMGMPIGMIDPNNPPRASPSMPPIAGGNVGTMAGGMVPVHTAGGAGLPTMVPQNAMVPLGTGAELGGGRGSSLDDLFGNGIVSGPGGSLPVPGGSSALMGDGMRIGGQDGSAGRHEARKQQILKQQRWLLFLRHCARCTLAEGECPYGGNCAVAKQLWDHLIQCKIPQCEYPRCSPSRELLKHHQRCKSAACPVCAPVKQYVARQREAIVRNKLDANGVSREDQDRMMAQNYARRGHYGDTGPARAAAVQTGAGGGNPNPPIVAAVAGAPSYPLQNMGAVVVAYPNQNGGVGESVVDDPSQAAKRPRLLLQENMGTSLIEYFTPEQIRMHIGRLESEGAAAIAAAGRRQSQTYNPAALYGIPDGLGGFYVEEESCCKVCHQNKLTFEPPTLYCYTCASKIKRNQVYYRTPGGGELRGNWCHPCATQTPGDTVYVESFAVRKVDLEKRKNDEEQEEGWVQCDYCEGWVHQVCGLFNKGRNNEDRGFLCPECLLQGLESGTRHVPRERPQAMLTAKDLPRCDLSDAIEERLRRTLTEEHVARAKAMGVNPKDIPNCFDTLTVRVINNVSKSFEVKPGFAQAFAGGAEGYPPSFTYKQKVVLLFQRLDGVDMCLYCLYVQEYGDECSPPNQRVIYLSYLDSVKYFQPDVSVATPGFNGALRTMVYHEVLMGYLSYAKARGYCSMYIWACPPLQGDDYIMYCHPGRQKVPRSDRLREWYLAMLRRAKSEGIISYISTLYDTYFEGGKDHRVERPSITDLPYLDGDYWLGEAENLLSEVGGGVGGGGGGGVYAAAASGDGGAAAAAGSAAVVPLPGAAAPKGRKGGKGKQWRPNPDATLAENLLGRLGEAIYGMREDFIVAHLYESCSHCRRYMDEELRYYHPAPPSKVVIKSERTFDGIALDRPGGEATKKITLTRFQLCQNCFDREGGRGPATPLGLPTGIALDQLVAEPCPKIPKIVDTVPQIDNEFFDTRQQFLSLCQGNHYQFDSLRRARHSSMMVLYHLHNPSEPAFSATCNICQKEIKPGEGFTCATCPDFDMCPGCHASPTVTHSHPLVPQTTRKFDETRMRMTDEDRANRDSQLQRTMQLLVHASACKNPACPSSNCAKVKALFSHAMSCAIKVTGGCAFCRRMWALLQAHSKMCSELQCPVPRCRELRAMRQQQAARQEEQRRAAYRQMLKQQQQSAG